MKDNIFIDTNIFVYMYGSDNQKKEKAINILYDNLEKIIISTQVINEFSNVLLKKFKLDIKTTKKIVNSIIETFKIVLIYPETIQLAYRLLEKYNFSYYDSLIVASALENKCKVLYSEDLQNGLVISKSLKVINPFL